MGMMEPPSGTSGSDEIADQLRGELDLDELTRARMEKSLLAAIAAGEHHAAVDVTLEAAGTDAPGRDVTPLRGWGALGVGTVLALAAAVALSYDPGAVELEPQPEVSASATFQRYEDGQTTARGDIGDGESLLTGVGERVEVRAADARVDVTPESEVRFVRLDAERVEVYLRRGTVEVELHPARVGDQTLRVTTERAHVDVVGTIFRVSVDDLGDTVVSTIEGTVRVTPRDGGEPQLVGGGEETTIRLPSLAAVERAFVSDVVVVVDDDVEPVEIPTERAPTMTELFARAEARLDDGDHSRGRRILSGITENANRPAHVVRAYTLLAESYASQREYARAAAAYGEAVDAGGHSIGAQNALFAKGRLLERQMHDQPAAEAIYRQYLDLAPGGAHADQIHRALCAMGLPDHC
jgi:hypothetical protein